MVLALFSFRCLSVRIRTDASIAIDATTGFYGYQHFRTITAVHVQTHAHAPAPPPNRSTTTASAGAAAAADANPGAVLIVDFADDSCGRRIKMSTLSGADWMAHTTATLPGLIVTAADDSAAAFGARPNAEAAARFVFRRSVLHVNPATGATELPTKPGVSSAAKGKIEISEANGSWTDPFYRAVAFGVAPHSALKPFATIRDVGDIRVVGSTVRWFRERARIPDDVADGEWLRIAMELALRHQKREGWKAFPGMYDDTTFARCNAVFLNGATRTATSAARSYLRR